MRVTITAAENGTLCSSYINILTHCPYAHSYLTAYPYRNETFLSKRVQIQWNSLKVLIQSPGNPGNDQYRCPVYLIGFHSKVTLVISCGHVLCKHCLDSFARRRLTNCPICKRRYRRSAAKRIYL